MRQGTARNRKDKKRRKKDKRIFILKIEKNVEKRSSDKWIENVSEGRSIRGEVKRKDLVQ
jgi:hypothetical protein